MRNHPIQVVNDPFQYRAIGIVRGTYLPTSEDKFTRGTLIDSDGNHIESVVLGRVITLMRRHLSLNKEHLWVVYPRSRESKHLHFQISGIWEPSTLSETKVLESISIEDNIPEGDDYFSIRGELIFTKPETNEIIIKIRQKPKTNVKKRQPFKLFINGSIPIENLRKFVSLDTRRIGQELFLEKYVTVGSLQNKSIKKSKKN